MGMPPRHSVSVRVTWTYEMPYFNTVINSGPALFLTYYVLTVVACWLTACDVLNRSWDFRICLLLALL